jgi:hypothetical protein
MLLGLINANQHNYWTRYATNESKRGDRYNKKQLNNLESLHHVFIFQTFWYIKQQVLPLKGKAVPQLTYGGARGERKYSTYSFTTSALDGG